MQRCSLQPFIIAKKVKQPNFPSTGELVNKPQFIHSVDHTSVGLHEFYIYNKDKCQQCNIEQNKMFTIYIFKE